MKIEINSYMSIEISEPNELIELMNDEDKMQLIGSLACHDVVIKHVADQIIHGCTETGNSGWESSGETPSTPLSIARREIANASGDIAKKEISRLDRMVKNSDKRNTELWDRIHKLERKS